MRDESYNKRFSRLLLDAQTVAEKNSLALLYGEADAAECLRRLGERADAAVTEWRAELQRNTDAALEKLKALEQKAREKKATEQPVLEQEAPSSTLKQQINELLWRLLPPATPLHAADNMACSWYDEVLEMWEKYK